MVSRFFRSAFSTTYLVSLAEENWVAVHTVIAEQDFWGKINQLKGTGAQGIVVMPIEKIIM